MTAALGTIPSYQVLHKRYSASNQQFLHTASAGILQAETFQAMVVWLTSHLDSRRKPALLDEGIVQGHHQACVPSLKQPKHLPGNRISPILHTIETC